MKRPLAAVPPLRMDALQHYGDKKGTGDQVGEEPNESLADAQDHSSTYFLICAFVAAEHVQTSECEGAKSQSHARSDTGVLTGIISLARAHFHSVSMSECVHISIHPYIDIDL